MTDACPVCGGVVVDEMPSGYWCKTPCNRLWSLAEMALARATRARERAAAYKAGLEAAAVELGSHTLLIRDGIVNTCADIRALPVEVSDEA
jgi:hypothetical protein